jgi:metal-dependent amidase/aminoacylase/carboxypeptidase family protein
VPTALKAGVGLNVIPSEAEATSDVRALPDEDIPRFLEDLKQLIDNPAVRIVPITTNLRPVGTPSPLDTEMYRALEHASAAMYPGATVLPTMSTGATDMAQLRAKGIASYGIGPPAPKATPSIMARTATSNDSWKHRFTASSNSAGARQWKLQRGSDGSATQQCCCAPRRIPAAPRRAPS